MAGLSVLLVEDDRDAAALITTALEARGHRVTWIYTARNAPSKDGFLAQRWGGGGRLDVVPADYDIAFVDGRLPGDHQGVHFVKALTEGGVACVGISAEFEYNQAMYQHGAVTAVRKDRFGIELADGDLDLEKVLLDERAPRRASKRK